MCVCHVCTRELILRFGMVKNAMMALDLTTIFTPEKAMVSLGLRNVANNYLTREHSLIFTLSLEIK